MAQTSVNDWGKVEQKIKKLEKLLREMGNGKSTELAGVGLQAIIEKILPFVSLNDRGESRGKFVGVLKQLKQNIPETLVRDKSRLADRSQKEDNQALTKGIQAGLTTRNNRSYFKFEINVTKPDHAKMRQALGNSLKRAVLPKLRELFARKLK